MKCGTEKQTLIIQHLQLVTALRSLPSGSTTLNPGSQSSGHPTSGSGAQLPATAGPSEVFDGHPLSVTSNTGSGGMPSGPANTSFPGVATLRLPSSYPPPRLTPLAGQLRRSRISNIVNIVVISETP